MALLDLLIIRPLQRLAASDWMLDRAYTLLGKVVYSLPCV